MRTRFGLLVIVLAALAFAPHMQASEPAGGLTQEADADAELRETVKTVPPQNLAGAYLNNENTLGYIALAGQNDLKRLNIFLSGVQVTAENVKAFQADHERRRDIYAAGILSRSFAQVGGRYSVQVQSSQSCAAGAPVPIELKQDGFTVKVLRAGGTVEEAVPGVVVEQTLVIGRGEYSPDNYLFGSIEGNRITMRAFSGSGCSMVLTRQ